MTALSVPSSLDDPINATILAISEDQLRGFQAEPFAEIASRSGVGEATVIERIRALMAVGVIRRVRQTVAANRLAAGALIAWKVPSENLDAAFDYMVQDDPFSGHVVIRSTDAESPGHDYRLWTTLKVPQGFSLQRHCEHLQHCVGASSYRAMPAERLFALGVGHLRRRTLEPGSKTPEPAEVLLTDVVRLSPRQWAVLTTLKREFALDEIGPQIWLRRAEEAEMSLDAFIETARELEVMGVMGRFSTFLEHVKPLATGERVTRYNALFHWSVPAGREIEAGREVGRHDILTHAYWREGGPEFANVNLMAVAHGLDKGRLLEHKCAIDAHLEAIGMPVSYTNVFWGGRSEIKPSEVLPGAYVAWCQAAGLDPEAMREVS